MMTLSDHLNINLVDDSYDSSIHGALIIIDCQACSTPSYDHYPLTNPGSYGVYSYKRITGGLVSCTFQGLNNLYLTADQKFMFAGGNNGSYYFCN
jgi:hypothetical protein